MPLPLLPIALRLGAVAAVALAARRAVIARTWPGRTDQRAEDALEDQDDGLAFHHPADTGAGRQTNAAARLRRVIHFRGARYEIDAGMMARFRIRKTDP